MEVSEKRKAMAKILVGLAQLTGRNMNLDGITLFVDAVEPVLSLEEFTMAVRTWQEKNRAFPMPVDLIEIVRPPIVEKDEAQIVVNKIIEAIKTHGYTWTQWVPKDRYVGGSWEADAKAYLGELGFHVVKAWGGWGSIHESYFSAGEETVWRAQLRDFVQTQVRLAKAGRLDYLPEIPKPLRLSDGQKGLPQRIDAAGLVQDLRPRIVSES